MASEQVAAQTWHECRQSLDEGKRGQGRWSCHCASRQAGIAELLAGNPLWHGSIRASHESSALDTRIASLERQQAAAALSAEIQLLQRMDLAETARLHGRSYVETRRFAPALEQFRLTLWSAPPTWPLRPRTKADVAALEEWLARH